MSLFASVDMWSPCHFTWVTLSFVRGLWECLYAKICSRVPCFFHESPDDSLGCNEFVSVFEFFFMPALTRFVSFRVYFVLFGGACLIWGHLPWPPTWGFRFIKCGVISPSITAFAASSVVLLYSTSVWDLNFPIYDFSCLESLYLSSWSVSCRRSFCRCCL